MNAEVSIHPTEDNEGKEGSGGLREGRTLRVGRMSRLTGDGSPYPQNRAVRASFSSLPSVEMELLP